MRVTGDLSVAARLAGAADDRTPAPAGEPFRAALRAADDDTARDHADDTMAPAAAQAAYLAREVGVLGGQPARGRARTPSEASRLLRAASPADAIETAAAALARNALGPTAVPATELGASSSRPTGVPGRRDAMPPAQLGTPTMPVAPDGIAIAIAAAIGTPAPSMIDATRGAATAIGPAATTDAGPAIDHAAPALTDPTHPAIGAFGKPAIGAPGTATIGVPGAIAAAGTVIGAPGTPTVGAAPTTTSAAGTATSRTPGTATVAASTATSGARDTATIAAPGMATSVTGTTTIAAGTAIGVPGTATVGTPGAATIGAAGPATVAPAGTANIDASGGGASGASGVAMSGAPDAFPSARSLAVTDDDDRPTMPPHFPEADLDPATEGLLRAAYGMPAFAAPSTVASAAAAGSAESPVDAWLAAAVSRAVGALANADAREAPHAVANAAAAPIDDPGDALRGIGLAAPAPAAPATPAVSTASAALTPLEQAVRDVITQFADPGPAHGRSSRRAIDDAAGFAPFAGFGAQPLAAHDAPSSTRAAGHATPASPIQLPEPPANPSHVHLVLDDGPERVVATVAVRGSEVHVALRTSDDATAAALARNAGSLDHAMRSRGLDLQELTADRDREPRDRHPQQDAEPRERRPRDAERFSLEEKP